MQITYKPYRKSEASLRFRHERKAITISGSNARINLSVDKIRQNVRLHVATAISSTVTLESRVEVLWCDKNGNGAEHGFLTYVEGSYKPSFRFSTDLRLQFFETGGYNSRIYAYESDVLYSFSIPPFFDRGFRYYLNLSYDVSKQLSFWARWAQTLYNSKDVIGSGLDEIRGNQRSEIKLQLRYSF